jgi:hypothetical protein
MFCETLDKHKKKYEIEGTGHAFLNSPQDKNEANRQAAEKWVPKRPDG